MKPTGEIKFKVLPRTDKADAPAVKKQATSKPQSQLTVYMGVAAVALLGFTLLTPKTHPQKATPRAGSSSQSSTAMPNDVVNESIKEHMLESEAKEALLVQQRQVENMQFQDDAKNMKDDQLHLPDQKEMGVTLNQEDTSDRVYEDLNGEPQRYADFLPSDKISAKLANRQWVNQQERAERIAFVSNFVKSAYDRGYEVDIDANLVVTGMHPIGAKKVNINQILDRLAHQ